VPGERRFRQLGLYTAYALVLPLKCPWADGTRHLLFEPLTLLEKLAALIPRPRTNLVVNPDPVAGEGQYRHHSWTRVRIRTSWTT
jgi:hypothetical protein